MKCAGMHPTIFCKKPHHLPATCCNCGGRHISAYKGCPVHQGIKRRLYPSQDRSNKNQLTKMIPMLKESFLINLKPWKSFSTNFRQNFHLVITITQKCEPKRPCSPSLWHPRTSKIRSRSYSMQMTVITFRPKYPSKLNLLTSP